MMASLEVGKLSRAVNAAKRSVKSSKIPVLNCLLLEFCKDARLAVTGSMLDIQIRAHAECDDVVEPFALRLPSARFAALVSSMRESKPVEIRLLDNKLVSISSEDMSSEMPYLPADIFPLSNPEVAEHAFEIQADEIKRMLDVTSNCVSTLEDRPFLQGVFMHVDNKQLDCRATDGHVFASARSSYLPDGLEKFEGIIIPGPAVSLLTNLLSSTERMVKFSISENHLRVDLPGREFLAKLVDYEYPDTNVMINHQRENHFSVSTGEFLSMMKRVTALAGRVNNAAKFEFNDGFIRATYRDNDYGITSDRVEAKRINGMDDITIGANPTYALSLAGLASSDRITAKLGNRSIPILIEEETYGDRFLLMPRALFD